MFEVIKEVKWLFVVIWPVEHMCSLMTKENEAQGEESFEIEKQEVQLLQ